MPPHRTPMLVASRTRLANAPRVSDALPSSAQRSGFSRVPGHVPGRAPLAACRGLVGKVPVVMDLECGANLSDRAGGFTHGIVVTLPDHAALPTYLDHPAHVPVATALVADVADLRVMDLQI